MHSSTAVKPSRQGRKTASRLTFKGCLLRVAPQEKGFVVSFVSTGRVMPMKMRQITEFGADNRLDSDEVEYQ
jgi:hypothetical protein